MKITVATCQFPVSANIEKNTRYILRQLEIAHSRSASVAHFCEASLSGYAGSDFESHDNFDWDSLQRAAERVASKAKELGIWIVLGSAHRLEKHKPHNSLYIIDSMGKLVDRYDKRFCAGDASGSRDNNASHYASNGR
jgi:deaminated glutathione amidase